MGKMMKVKRLMRKKKDEHSDEEEIEGSLYVEDDAELSECHGNNSHCYR